MRCPPPGSRLALFGDSFAEGLAPELGRRAAECGDRLSVDTVSGSNSSYWTVERVKAATRGARIVLVSLGGNDFAREPGSVALDAQRIARQLARAGKRALWISPLRLPFADQAGAREAWSRAVPEHVKWEAILDFPRAPDGVHLSAPDYAKWAGAVWNWMSILTGGQPKAPAVAPSALVAAGLFGFVAARSRGGQREP